MLRTKAGAPNLATMGITHAGDASRIVEPRRVGSLETWRRRCKRVTNRVIKCGLRGKTALTDAGLANFSYFLADQ